MQPIKTRPPRSKAQPEIPEYHRRYLIDGDQNAFLREPAAFFLRLGDHRAAWERIRSELTAEYRRKHPGRRPWAWWAFDAPGPRRQIGGTGKTILAKGPHFPPVHFGIPRIVKGQAEFETETEFLKRHGLLTKTEQKALKKANSRAETRTQ